MTENVIAPPSAATSLTGRDVIDGGLESNGAGKNAKPYRSELKPATRETSTVTGLSR